MTNLLTREERRYIARGVLGFTALILSGGVAWSSGWSPAALETPAAMAIAGDTEAAIDAYRDVADGYGAARVRAEALWRAGLLAAVDGHAPVEATELFERVASEYPGFERAPDAKAWVGRLAQTRGEFVEAARAFEAAATLAPDRVDAGAWLVEAGRLYHEAGQAKKAVDAYERAAEREESRVEGHLALARLLLAEDPAASVAHYDQVLSVASEGPSARVAALGRGMALERLERSGEILADAGELPTR